MKNAYSTVYVMNIAFQSIFTLLWQIAASFFVSWALVEWASAPDWIYVPIIIAGVVIGFVSMIRFILSAMNSLDRIEAERRAKIKGQEKKNGQ